MQLVPLLYQIEKRYQMGLVPIQCQLMIPLQRYQILEPIQQQLFQKLELILLQHY